MNTRTIEELMKELDEKGVNLVSFARIFGINVREIDKLIRKKDKVFKALLNMVVTYPWLILVAECDFDEKESRRIMMHGAVDTLIDEGK